MKLIYLLALTASLAHAAPRQTKIINDNGVFYSLDNSSLDSGTLYYSLSLSPSGDLPLFTEWQKATPTESAALSLYPGYKEPTIHSKDVLGIESDSTLTLRIFSEKAKLLLGKAPDQINLKRILSIDMVRKFDVNDPNDGNAPENISIPINASQVMSEVVKNGQPVQNFDQCNTDGTFFSRPKHETALQSTINPNRAWCTDTNHAICVESCSKFRGFWAATVNGINTLLPDDQKKDNGIADQFEVRYFANEKDLGLNVALKELTQLDTRVRGGIEINMFYFDQIVQFGKVITVLQEAPGNPNATVMTTFFVVAVKDRNYSQVKSAMLPPDNGQNMGGSITSGLPAYTRNVINVLANELEK